MNIQWLMGQVNELRARVEALEAMEQSRAMVRDASGIRKLGQVVEVPLGEPFKKKVTAK